MVYNLINGKPYVLMDDLEGKPPIFGNILLNMAIFGIYMSNIWKPLPSSKRSHNGLEGIPIFHREYIFNLVPFSSQLC